MAEVVLLRASIPMLTTNPNNGPQGNTRLAGILKARTRRAQRKTVRELLQASSPRFPGVVTEGSLTAACEAVFHSTAITITVTRVAPSNGLDPHDGLGAALKSVIDGVADAIGLKNDRGPFVTWRVEQRRGPPKHYSVEVFIEAAWTNE